MFLAQQDNRPLIEFTLAPLREDFGVPLAIMGILVVFLALILVVLFITALPWLLASSKGKASAAAAAESEQPAPMLAGDEDELPEEILVAISAAVAHVIGKPHRIVQIRGLTPAELGWSLGGRMSHHHSHRIQRRGRP